MVLGTGSTYLLVDNHSPQGSPTALGYVELLGCNVSSRFLGIDSSLNLCKQAREGHVTLLGIEGVAVGIAQRVELPCSVL